MKAFIVILFLLALAFNTSAQIISGYGIKAGIGLSNQTWDYSNAGINLDFENRIGISPRLFAEFFHLALLQVQAELGYLQKGFKEEVLVTTMSQPAGNGESITTNVRLNYFSFSALAKFKYENELLSPYIILGPQLNILISKNIEKGWEAVFDNFKGNNIGVSLGAGTEIKKALPFSIFIEYRFERDLIDNYDSPNVDIKNYSHIFLIGIKL